MAGCRDQQRSRLQVSSTEVLRSVSLIVRSGGLHDNSRYTQVSGVELGALLSAAKIWIEYLARSVDIAAALIIGLASLQATFRSLLLFFHPGAPPEVKNNVRLTLGRWLAVALEFELAADILNTAVTPSWTDIEKLAAIAALRTALNYFLEREIQEEASPLQRVAESQATAPMKP